MLLFLEQVYTWDPRKMDEKLSEIDLDSASGVLMAFVDEDTNMLYLGGKGDGAPCVVLHILTNQFFAFILDSQVHFDK